MILCIKLVIYYSRRLKLGKLYERLFSPSFIEHIHLSINHQNSQLNICQEDKYNNIDIQKMGENESEVKRLLAIFLIGLVLISLPSILWSGIEKYCNINYVDHTSPDGSRIILSNNPNAVDPTYEELITFLKNEKNIHEGYMDSSKRAQMLNGRAEKAGYRCAWVYVQFIGEEECACNAFNTIDKGVIFVDSMSGSAVGISDLTVDLAVGKQYILRDVFNSSMIYDSMGIVKDYKIYW